MSRIKLDEIFGWTSDDGQDFCNKCRPSRCTVPITINDFVAPTEAITCDECGALILYDKND